MQNLENIKTEILVFDWQGNPVADCKLDRSITAFTVSSDNKKLYAVLITRENEIYEFDLSGLLSPNEN